VTPDVLLQLESVSKTFGGVRALRGVSFDVRPGEIHALVGENGAGKSTLLRLVTGAHAADEGRVEIGGQRLTRADPVLARQLGVAPIYQQPTLLPDLTVAENLALRLERGGGWRRVNWRQRRARAAELLARVGADVDVEAAAGTLRMAEQQLVEIAGAIGAEARVLLMDEPTASLTTREAARLFDLMRDLRARGVGLVYVSHRLEEISAMADRVTVLRDGERVATRDSAGLTHDEMIRLMVGREIDRVYPKREVPIGDVVVETRGVCCAASGLQGIDLQIRAGEIVGLAGLVGAGRTELARVLFGLTPCDAGSIRIDGQAVRIGTPADAVRRGIAYVPEDRRRHGIVPELSVAANVSLASLPAFTRGAGAGAGIGRGIGSGMGVGLGWLDTRRERQTAEDYTRRLAIKAASIDAPVGTLSGGNQQKVALARWLTTSPRLLILDEPTQGVDVGAKSEIHALIMDLAARGLGILLISSELPEILGMSDRIAVMHGGRLTGVLDRRDATQEAVMRLALGPSGLGAAVSAGASVSAASSVGGDAETRRAAIREVRH
jgi:rhamnose transport system ATP-binding protein